ncbi:predicted protein [Naegleria gruberi]|uniref:Predicted protein n=1 Tax=Naegleria gruberi TaxID=5762 RepID=D2VCJ4_NAEGR|nr:uncharacterized protein NAEGRDRAFT_66592 [Naegleria gruberi]EFC45322.1 predicted protein [Naegleria gruberi]|eukprot:XP_002678066.1 predicted protein [Naegleria gruberi strain NEG-M]
MLDSIYSLFTYGKSLLIPTPSEPGSTNKNENNQLEQQYPIDRMSTTRNFSDYRFEYYYNLDDDSLFYKRSGWAEYCNNKLGLVFRYPTVNNLCIEVLPLGDGVISVQLREKESETTTNGCSSSSS